MRGTHESALEEEAIANFAAEAKAKVASNQARLVCYEKGKRNFPTKMKVSIIAAISHKSKAFRLILDLSFTFKLTPHGRVPSVNENSEKTSPGGAIEQIGHVLLGLVHAFAEALDCENIFQENGISRIGF